MGLGEAGGWAGWCARACGRGAAGVRWCVRCLQGVEGYGVGAKARVSKWGGVAGYDRLIKLWDAPRGLITHR